jgi:DNA-binding NarL/FixJ family response regulator
VATIAVVVKVMGQTTTAVVIDRWPMVRLGIGEVLGSGAVIVVGEAAKASDGLLLARTHEADLVVFGATADGLAPATVRLAKAGGLTAGVIILVNGPTSTADLVALLAAGADALLVASVDRAELADALERVKRGERVVARSLGPSLAGFRDGRDERPVTAESTERGPLTAKEVEVLGLLAQGHSNKQIARALFVSDATVKTHLQHIYAKLDAQGRHGALTRAAELGLLT